MATQTKGLGRIVEPDPDDLRYLMRAARPQAFARPVGELPTSLHYRRGAMLDQGDTGSCVGFSMVAKLAGAPVRVGPTRLPSPYAIYDEACELDETLANGLRMDPLRQYGTTLRAGCKALQSRGLITSYHWAYTVEEALQWILAGQGGGVLGVDFYAEMAAPTKEGIIRARGRHLGGHAIYAYGADRVRGFIDLQNSWGANWGGFPAGATRRIQNHGCARLPLEDLKKLLDGNGEFCAAIETPYRRGFKAQTT